MQLTIDSSEPLRKVAAVVGALYGVELVVADGSSATASAAPAASGRRRSRSAAAPTSGKRSGRRRGGRPVDAKVVRQWAVEQGLTVSTRGQLPKSVLAAYADSNAS